MNHIGIKLSMDAGGLISSAAAAKQAVRDLDREIEQAEKKGDRRKVGELYFAKQKMSAVSEGFQRDINNYAKNPIYQQIMKKQESGQALSKKEEQYIDRLDKLSDSMRKNTEALLKSKETGDMAKIHQDVSQFDKQAADFHKIANPNAEKENQNNWLKGLGLEKIFSAINQGLSVWAGSIDRSGIISQYGSGDIFGGRLAEKERVARRNSGIVETVGGVAGAGLSFVPGVGIPLGMATVAVSKMISTLITASTAYLKNDVAYASLWDQQSKEAMNLAALKGNPSDVRGTWREAADTAQDYGFSASEGMDLTKQFVMQGVDSWNARDLADQVFKFERSTGADRSIMSSVSAMSERYGGGDALRAGWRGLQASGMQTAQYGEYLNGLKRVMETAIQNGFVKSSDQVARNLTMLAQITNNDPLWQGERGAQRLQKMDSGLAGATGLQSSSDILAYRAVRNTMTGGENADWIDVIAKMEEGVNSDVIKEYIRLVSASEGGSRSEIINRIKQSFGLTTHEARSIYDGRDIPTNNTLNRIMNEQRDIPTVESPEYKSEQMSAEIQNMYIKAGRITWDEMTIKAMEEELINSNAEYRRVRDSYGDGTSPSPSSPVPYTPRVYSEGDYTGRITALMGQYGAGAPNEVFNPFFSKYNEFRSGQNGHDNMIDRSEVQILIPYLRDMATATSRNTEALQALVNELGLDITFN